ncbi:MAG: hypothetical protein LBT59_01135 [Clostridiales bacterium]|nr:hypothetical protein [Clostridiales bacterium]
MSNNCWLPSLVLFSAFNNVWLDYEKALYEIFKTDFIDSKPVFQGKHIYIRKHPMEFDKKEAYYHLTCQDYLKDGNRSPDFRRCERIRWVRSFLENYQCDPSQCCNCEGIKVWEEKSRSNKTRISLLFEEERYSVLSAPAFYKLPFDLPHMQLQGQLIHHVWKEFLITSSKTFSDATVFLPHMQPQGQLIHHVWKEFLITSSKTFSDE